jgi:FkbM family methyltransferase
MAIQALTRLPRSGVWRAVDLAGSGSRGQGSGSRGHPALAALRWWLRRGHVRVPDGPGNGLRLARADVVAQHIQAFGLVRGTLETSVQEAMRRTVASGGTFYDIGANLGFFSLLGARMAGPDGRVIAFEPHPANAALIKENATLNGLQTIHVCELALGRQTGADLLYDVAEASWSRLVGYGRHPDARGTVSVSVAAIDDLLEEGRVPPPEVVKIDAEGAELDILAGMARTLAARRPALICELHATNAAFVDLMDSSGYRVENLDGPEPVASAPPDIHVLALPA